MVQYAALTLYELWAFGIQLKPPQGKCGSGSLLSISCPSYMAQLRLSRNTSARTWVKIQNENRRAPAMKQNL